MGNIQPDLDSGTDDNFDTEGYINMGHYDSQSGFAYGSKIPK